MSSGYACICGTFNAFSPYVIAHWDIPLAHTCKCGETAVVQAGRAELKYTGEGLKSRITDSSGNLVWIGPGTDGELLTTTADMTVG